ncbi:MAG: hypothetical protein EOP51_04255 [Sphingobacteriales bacterium]|nr:MAG: hypothetical protein EOP51_04255 [Sphingobacteriales bacterium]
MNSTLPSSIIFTVIILFSLVSFTSCSKKTTCNPKIVYEGQGCTKGYAMIGIENKCKDALDVTIKATTDTSSPVTYNVNSEETKYVLCADTTQKKYAWITSYTDKSKNLSNNPALKTTVITVLGTLIIQLIIILLGYGTARTIYKNNKKEDKTEVKSRESQLLAHELQAINTHLDKNKGILDKIVIRKTHEIPLPITFQKMKIDENAVSLSLDTVRLFIDDKAKTNTVRFFFQSKFNAERTKRYRSHLKERAEKRAREGSQKLLSLRLSFRNLNTEIDQLNQLIEKGISHKVYIEFMEQMKTKLQHVEKKTKEIDVILKLKMEEKKMANTKGADVPIIYMEYDFKK